MKRLVLIAMVLVGVLVMLLGSTAYAADLRTMTGATIDAPNLIRLTTNLTLGLEGGKDLYTNPFRSNSAWLEDDKGFFGYFKITYTGTLFNFAR